MRVQLKLPIKKYKNTTKILKIKKPNNKAQLVIIARVFQMKKVSILNNFPNLRKPKLIMKLKMFMILKSALKVKLSNKMKLISLQLVSADKIIINLIKL